MSAEQDSVVIARAFLEKGDNFVNDLKVVQSLSQPEVKSLTYILATGTKEDILNFIQNEDILDYKKSKF